MEKRLELDAELRSFLGSSNIYFQPPESIKLKYPCIIYRLRTIDSQYADDRTYKNMKAYEIIFITKDSDNDYVERMLNTFKYIYFDRFFVNDNLNHYVFNVFF